MFNLFRDLFSGQFAENKAEGKEERRLNRFIFNLISVVALDPLYLLSGVIQLILGIPLLILMSIPNQAATSFNTSAIFGVEWLNAKMYEGLAESLGINEGKYLKDSFTLQPLAINAFI